MVRLLDLRQGEIVLDAQADADLLLPMAAQVVGDRGRAIGLAFGQRAMSRLEELMKERPERVELMPMHPSNTSFKDRLFHGVVLRHTGGMRQLGGLLSEMHRVTKPSGRVVACHTQWECFLPKASEREEELLRLLISPAVTDGFQFFTQFRHHPSWWSDVRLDVYGVANRDKQAQMHGRFKYDWRTMLRDQVGKDRGVEPREVLDLIERLENTRGARVRVERYLALGIRR